MLNINKLKKNNLSKDPIFNIGNVTNEIKSNSFNKEWSNTVFFFNKNNEKSLPSIDTSVFNIIKKFFNMFSIHFERSILMRKKAVWRRRLKLNKIFLAKPEFKHTNDKVVITLYMYNRQLSILKRRFKKLRKLLYTQYFFRVLVKNTLITKKINIMKTLLNKFNSIKTQVKKLKKIMSFYSEKLLTNKSINKRKYLKIRKSYKNLLKHLLVLRLNINNIKRILNINKKRMRTIKSVNRVLKKVNNKNFIKKSTRILSSILTYLNVNNKLSYLFNNKINKFTSFKVNNLIYLRFIKKSLWRMRLYIRTNRLIKFNKFKFNVLLQPLKLYLEKIYNKNVEFNIISLKSFYLNSSILTQIIAIKLRNRKFRLLRVMNKVLSKIKVPFNRRLKYFSETPRIKYIQNIILKQYLNKNYLELDYSIDVNSFYKHLKKKEGEIYMNDVKLIKNNNDKLDSILKSIYPIEYNINSNNTKFLKRNLKNTVLDTINNKTITGIRIEGSGRLTKRISAARAISKMRQIGTIKNINSSYKKTSSILLRGYLKSNLQFSKANNKTRIGSYGIKGWISSI